MTTILLLISERRTYNKNDKNPKKHNKLLIIRMMTKAC